MAEKQPAIDLSFSGLFTNGNVYSAAPEGSFEVADNVVLRSPKLIEPRPGFDQHAPEASNGPHGAPSRLVSWRGRMLAFTDGAGRNAPSGSGYVAPIDETTLLYGTPYGSFSFSQPVRTAKANQSLYWTTSKGVKKLESTATSTPIRDAGAPDPAHAYLSSQDTGVSGGDWLAVNSAVAYRVTLARFDANNYFLEGTPSARLVVTNSLSGTSTPHVGVILGADIDSSSGWLVRVFRGAAADQTIATDPSDECFQVAEHIVTASDVSAGLWVYDDTAALYDPSSPLYTNANTGDGIAASNDRPPLAQDVCAFKGMVLYANTAQRQSLEIALLGTGAPNGLQSGDVITLNGVAFTCGASNDSLNRIFKLETSGSTGQKLENTARNFAYVVSLYWTPALASTYSAAGLTVPDYTKAVRVLYASTSSFDLGKLYLEAAALDQAAFTFQVSAHGSAWSPNATAAVTSSNNAQPAGLSWSDDGEPEGVPLDNFVIVGDPAKPILRVVQLGQTAFIFKQNDGLWTLTGSDASTFDLRQFDASVNLLAPDALCIQAGAIFAFTNHGVEAITEAGRFPQPVSRPIEQDLFRFRAQNPDFDSKAFLASVETEGLVILGVPAAYGDAGCSYQYVFNPAAPGWTRWIQYQAVPVTHAVVHDGDNKLWLGGISRLLRQRKSYDSTDAQESFLNGFCAPITSALKLNPISPASPLVEKKWSDIFWSFSRLEVPTLTFSIETDRQMTPKTVTKTGATPYAWGSFVWGMVPWMAATRNSLVRQDVPQSAAAGSMVQLGLTLSTMAAVLSATEPAKTWQLQGISVLYEPTTLLLRR